MSPQMRAGVIRVFLVAVDSFAGERFDDREHAAIAQVAIVRDSEYLTAGFFFAHCHPLPKVPGIVAPEGFLSYERLNQARPQCILAEDDIAVQIVSARIRRPLETDERGELSGLIGLVRRLIGFLR